MYFANQCERICSLFSGHSKLKSVSRLNRAPLCCTNRHRTSVQRKRSSFVARASSLVVGARVNALGARVSSLCYASSPRQPVAKSEANTGLHTHARACALITEGGRARPLKCPACARAADANGFPACDRITRVPLAQNRRALIRYALAAGRAISLAFVARDPCARARETADFSKRWSFV